MFKWSQKVLRCLNTLLVLYGAGLIGIAKVNNNLLYFKSQLS